MVEDVVSSIKKGGIALVDAKGVAPDQPPKVIQAGGAGGVRVPYVAISHVWSDGLGNPWRNCLRLCQLHHIQDLVNGLYDSDQQPAPFWIDTMGIPVGREHAEYRKIAIHRIAETFRNADKVLVIDNSLQTCRADLPWVEVLMRIQYSPWMTRLWTLLEGKLAPKLYFQFAERAIPSESLTDVTVSRNSLLVSSVLEALPVERLQSCPSAVQLIRGLTVTGGSKGLIESYAALPIQSNPQEERLRLQAIKLLIKNKEDYALQERWRPFLLGLGLFDQLDDNDEAVKADIDVAIYCPVTLHAFNSVTSVRGAEFGSIPPEARGADESSTMTVSSSPQEFEDAAMGFRARTTSRLDDETLCLGAILGADLADVLRIPTMDWRWREWLDAVDCSRSRKWMVRRLGINTRRFTDACHLKRMAALLSQIRKFPLSIIFWNTLRLDGHTWAPRSLLDRDLAVQLPQVVGTATLGDNGLEFVVSAHKLAGMRQLSSAAKPAALLPRALGRIKKDSSQAILTISQLGSTAPGVYGTSWLSVQFLPGDKTIASTSEGRRTWQDYGSSIGFDHLAVLFRGDFGALVRVYREQNGIFFAKHIRLVQKATPGAPAGPTVSGTWLNQARWCLF